MLPGFRFLFAATLLTLSLVVFGLGAAALLRASHDRFASLPIRPLTGPALVTVGDAVTPTLSMLRIEPPEPTESRAAPDIVAQRMTTDTLMPNDKVATFITAPRVEDVIPTPPVVAEPKKVELKVEPKTEAKAEPKSEAKLEPKADDRPEPPKAEAKAEAAVETPAQTTAPKASVAEAASATPTAASTPVEPAVVAKIDESAKVETPPAPQQVAALAESDITATIPAPPPIDLSLVNARPIRKPPVPRDRPVDADVVAALPDPAIVAPAPEAEKPVLRRRRTVTKRVIRKRRSVSRPAATQNASPFGT